MPSGMAGSRILVLDPFTLVDLTAALVELGPLTLQCLDGSKFLLDWPAKIKYER